MDFDQKLQDLHLKEHRKKSASTAAGDFTNGGKALESFPLCSPPTTAVMNYGGKEGPPKGKRFLRRRHWQNPELNCNFWTFAERKKKNKNNLYLAKQ